jgi:hypothetical protein
VQFNGRVGGRCHPNNKYQVLCRRNFGAYPSNTAIENNLFDSPFHVKPQNVMISKNICTAQFAIMQEYILRNVVEEYLHIFQLVPLLGVNTKFKFSRIRIASTRKNPKILFTEIRDANVIVITDNVLQIFFHLRLRR